MKLFWCTSCRRRRASYVEYCSIFTTNGGLHRLSTWWCGLNVDARSFWICQPPMRLVIVVSGVSKCTRGTSCVASCWINRPTCRCFGTEAAARRVLGGRIGSHWSVCGADACELRSQFRRRSFIEKCEPFLYASAFTLSLRHTHRYTPSQWQTQAKQAVALLQRPPQPPLPTHNK